MRQVPVGREGATGRKIPGIKIIMSGDLRCLSPHSVATQESSLHVARPNEREDIFMKKSRTITIMGLTIALNIILSHMIAFQPAPFVRIGISFIAVVFGSMYCGPILGGAGAAIADILGYCFFPTGAYVPGLTVSAFLTGLTFGLLLYKKKPAYTRVLIAAIITCVLIQGFLSSYWLYLIIPGYTFWAIALPRLIVNLIMVPVEATLIFMIWRKMGHLNIGLPSYSVSTK
jgi:ECF transporter S component (folate family)